MAVRRLDDTGQMTIGLAVALPVAIAVALISYNALVFFSECAKFDRLARNAVRICAVSPSYGQGVQERCASAEAMVENAMGCDGLSCSSSVSSASGAEVYELTLEYEPTLFGIGLRGDVFGVEMPALRHSTRLSVDSYDPGVLL